ncbi:MAG: hypothetical protein CBB68_13120 [Rhodospirillaceae bacterium TMED8]|nr:hypothetical protein [Magnetovibrio sp.]OUT49044.1 MAG: hypothetical protein CBB68_13120 [Rhodospirillaceae bacterium TMED8]
MGILSLSTIANIANAADAYKGKQVFKNVGLTARFRRTAKIKSALISSGLSAKTPLKSLVAITPKPLKTEIADRMRSRWINF